MTVVAEVVTVVAEVVTAIAVVVTAVIAVVVTAVIAVPVVSSVLLALFVTTVDFVHKSHASTYLFVHTFTVYPKTLSSQTTFRRLVERTANNELQLCRRTLPVPNLRLYHGIFLETVKRYINRIPVTTAESLRE